MTLWICAICRRVLDSFADGELTGVTLQHAAADRAADHEAVPIQVDESEALARCDFCQVDILTEPWLIITKPVSIDVAALGDAESEYVALDFGERWAADDDCAELLRQGDWTALRERAVAGFVKVSSGAMPPDMANAFVAILFNKVKANLISGPQRLKEEQ